MKPPSAASNVPPLWQNNTSALAFLFIFLACYCCVTWIFRAVTRKKIKGSQLGILDLKLMKWHQTHMALNKVSNNIVELHIETLSAHCTVFSARLHFNRWQECNFIADYRL